MEWLEVNWKWLFAVLNVLFVIACWVLSRQFAKKDDHVALVGEVDKLKDKVELMPNTEQVHALELQIATLSGEIKSVVPLLKRVEHQSNLLLENELNGKS
jgi:hypothetical protein